MIHIGDRWGKRYDYVRYYLPFRLRFGLKFDHWHNCREALRDPFMYMPDGFKPMKNEVVWDVGSQFGDFALIWSKYASKVFAFELDANNYRELQENLKLNKADNVTAFNIAIGNGESIEYTMNGNMANPAIDGIRIKTTRLDDLDFPKPNILKIDVEGFELIVLHGARTLLDEHPIKLIVETHSSDLRKRVDKFLDELEYYPVYIGRTTKGKEWMDEVTNVFYEKESE